MGLPKHMDVLFARSSFQTSTTACLTYSIASDKSCGGDLGTTEHWRMRPPPSQASTTEASTSPSFPGLHHSFVPSYGEGGSLHFSLVSFPGLRYNVCHLQNCKQHKLWRTGKEATACSVLPWRSTIHNHHLPTLPSAHCHEDL